ncbi:DUF441 domain-containing protein [Tenuibacillus multivorans]|uniref:UPF0756 membrane protein SAMN05216498_1842 n=1 Tax=Tenuibacillus multivorans TaxID=237069 RepID=A0A1G9ZTB3_9BACI|nr:DUF441 domain-containing protein [Tenuibacillus multivorans]GEL76849.1 UPF0756 membrane protein YtwI [Tenuibacillus multivorans]SDN24659.1 Uncharacterized membrane protein, DUF441 family [Tenuibacillus multivorans]
MLTSSTLFLLILLGLGFIAKNQAILIAVYILLGIKLFKLDDKVFPFLEAKGLFIGVVIITVAVLVPIATGEIGFSQLLESIKSYYAWIALLAGMFVAYVAKDGLNLLANDPHLTVALVLGTIFAVVFFQGVAVGPLIGAGIAYLAMQAVDAVLKLFS